MTGEELVNEGGVVVQFRFRELPKFLMVKQKFVVSRRCLFLNDKVHVRP